MRNIDHLIQKLIPPDTYRSRNGFTNHHIVSSLTEDEKSEVECVLIKMLANRDDELIGETLALMQSSNSLNILNKKLAAASEVESKIIWASFINQIKGGDEEMKQIALKEMDKLDEKYSKTRMFYYLSGFKDRRINDKIQVYANHDDYLIAYNARAALGMNQQGPQHKSLND